VSSRIENRRVINQALILDRLKLWEVIKVKLGCNTLLFNQLDLYGALQHIAWAGYDGAEICFQPILCNHIELNIDKSYIDEVKHAVKKLGLELFAIHAGWGPGFEHLLDEDKIKLLKKVFDMACKLNIPVVAIRTFGKSDDKETTKQQFKYIRKLCEQAESRGITLAVKAHIAASVYNIATTEQMLNEIDSRALGINLAAFQLYKVGEDPSEAVLKFGKKIVHVHFGDAVKALQFGPPEPGYDQIPGRNDIDFPKILRRLKDIGYDGAIDVHVTCNLPLPIRGQIPYPLTRNMGIAAEARGYLNRCLQELKWDSN
jgi:sugar phosphate isomerase/epimerase